MEPTPSTSSFSSSAGSCSGACCGHNSTGPKFESSNYLTKKLDEVAQQAGLEGRVCKPPFGFYIRDDQDDGRIVAACHGCVIFEGIYTDQIWVHPNHRQRGYARELMDKIEEYGRQQNCKVAYVMANNTYDGAQGFLFKMGYSTTVPKDSCIWQDNILLVGKIL